MIDSSPACIELRLLLMERASGALASEEATRLDAHLATCSSCRSELAKVREVLDMARLTPLPWERRVPPLAEGLRAALRRDTLQARRRRVASVALGGGLAVAAAVAVIALSPGLAGRSVKQEQVAVEEWQPDIDGALEASGLVVQAASTAYTGIEDSSLEGLTLAALDDAGLL